MTSSSSNARCPRSAYDQVGGLVYFARMIDKIRLKAKDQLLPDYHENLGKGFDGRCIRFLGVNYAALCERAAQGGSDEEILAWCFEKGRKPSEEEVLVWNSFLRKRGWGDEADDGVSQELDNYKSRSGLAHRTDIQTFFDYYEVDEGRRP